MPSRACLVDLEQLLVDADELDDLNAKLQAGPSAPPVRFEALDRAVVVVCVSAWESFVEALILEAVAAVLPVGGAPGIWPIVDANSLVGRFNTPNAANVKSLISACIGLSDITASWAWPGTIPAQAVQKLNEALNYRHEIAHGVNPRPAIQNTYAGQLIVFIRRLAIATDAGVRDHIVAALGVANPWTP